MTKTILLIGVSGSGKDTQAKLISEKQNYINLSSGDLLRNIAKLPENVEIKSKIESGHLVEDEVVYELLEHKLKDLHNKNIILNGVVRTQAQIQLLENLLSNLNRKLDMVIYLDLERDVSIERLRKRARNDDKIEYVERRLEWHKKFNKQILDYYNSKKLLHVINANDTIENIFEKIVKLITTYEKTYS